MVKLGLQAIVFYVCGEQVRGIINLTELIGQDAGLTPPLFYCLVPYLVLLLHGFVAKQACLVLWLSKPAFLSNP